MKLMKRMKRGGPQLVAPLWEWLTAKRIYPSHMGGGTDTMLVFAEEGKEDPDHDYRKQVSPAYELTFENEEDLAKMMEVCFRELSVRRASLCIEEYLQELEGREDKDSPVWDGIRQLVGGPNGN